MEVILPLSSESVKWGFEGFLEAFWSIFVNVTVNAPAGRAARGGNSAGAHCSD